MIHIALTNESFHTLQINTHFVVSWTLYIQSTRFLNNGVQKTNTNFENIITYLLSELFFNLKNTTWTRETQMDFNIIALVFKLRHGIYRDVLPH